MEKSLSRQSIGLVLTTKHNETQHHKHRKHKSKTEKTALANKRIDALVCTAFTTSGQETEAWLFLQPHSPHGDCVS